MPSHSMDSRLIRKYGSNRKTTPALPSPPGPDRVFKGNSLFRGGLARAGLKGEGLGGGDTLDILQRYFGINLLVADSQNE